MRHKFATYRSPYGSLKIVAALPHAGLDDVAFMPKAGCGEAEVTSEVWQVLTADVAQLDVLEVVPDALVRVKVRGVAGELLELDAPGAALGQEVFDWLAAMDRGAVPDDQELAGDVAEQVLEEADDVRTLVRVLLDQHQQPTRRGDAADNGQMVTAQGEAEDRRLAARGVGPDGAGQQVEAGLVDPDDGPSFLVRPFLSSGQRSVRQASIAASLRWLAR